ncbi:hypothetical protein I553_1224 [Mycobacterium xenopi 4042]|uniref:Uncharacterized protein n=1 Tax=Mycobacterium xenopi 4042 TaxID=1299334 RepID=X7ZA59_MYCXE|nr:hypothetical protein I553_1224 [Mycobacterium xenopi 4042]
MHGEDFAAPGHTAPPSAMRGSRQSSAARRASRPHRIDRRRDGPGDPLRTGTGYRDRQPEAALASST